MEQLINYHRYVVGPIIPKSQVYRLYRAYWGECESIKSTARSRMTEDTINCPACDSDAYYRYGRAKNGKRRHLCLACGRQYIIKKSRKEVSNRPNCPICQEPMNVYQRHGIFTRFRCKNYPACRNYVRIDNNQLNKSGNQRKTV